MSSALADMYAQALAALERDEFQVEVSARFAHAIMGFQTIPPNPQGDGGLDGLSHGGERGYCCYGPQHNPAKTPKERVAAIVDKFGEDLRRLFELETKGSVLIHEPNVELGTILPSNQRLLEIKLIVNWFESHRVIGPILSLVPKYKSASQCNFVDPAAVVRVMGPKELANEYPVDEMTIARVKGRAFLDRVHNRAKALTLANPRDFDAKMKALESLRPGQAAAITALGDQFREDWRTALAFEHELDDTLPSLHRSLEMARGQILTRVTAAMVSSATQWGELERVQGIAERILERDFSPQYAAILPSVATGEVARLIGECTIDWRKVESGNSPSVI